jgi:hypothetical protein
MIDEGTPAPEGVFTSSSQQRLYQPIQNLNGKTAKKQLQTLCFYYINYYI